MYSLSPKQPSHTSLQANCTVNNQDPDLVAQLFCAVPAFMLYMYSTVYSLIRVFVMTSNWLRHTWSAIGVNMLLFSSFLATSYNFSAHFCAEITTHNQGLFVSNSQNGQNTSSGLFVLTIYAPLKCLNRIDRLSQWNTNQSEQSTCSVTWSVLLTCYVVHQRQSV